MNFYFLTAVNFLKKHINVLLILCLIFTLTYSLWFLTTKPRVWIDESSTIEIAHNFSTNQRLDIEISPGKFTGVPYLLQSTGYPVTTGMALFFKVFGYGFYQARIYMVIWMMLALWLVYFFGSKLFGRISATCATMLIAIFSSFFNSARCAVGEVPGFVFLLTGLYLYFGNLYYAAGFLLGLAVVSKPSVFLLIVPTIGAVALLEKENASKKIFQGAVGMIPAALLWVVLLLEKPFMLDTWREILNFYSNPFGSSVWVNILNNIKSAPFTATLVYFGFLFLFILYARYLAKDKKIASFLNFVIIYSIFAFIYYLRSPGWLRYILIAELLIFVALPYSVNLTLQNMKRYLSKINVDSGVLAAVFVVVLFCINLSQLVLTKKIFYSDYESQVGSLINDMFPNKKVAILNSMPIAIFIDQQNRYQVLDQTAVPEAKFSTTYSDSKPFTMSPAPDIVVYSDSRRFFSDDDSTGLFIEEHYKLVERIGSYSIYEFLK
jgi:hypothetical protein